jgi:Domain of unknown function (DUF1772)
LFAGFLLAVLVLETSKRTAPAAVYIQVRQVELMHLDDLATILLPAALLATAVLAVITVAKRLPGRWLALTALVLLAVVLLISATVNVPINAEQLGWSALSPPHDWASARERWQFAHLASTISALAAFLVLVKAAV